jgi:phosphopentomutase
MDELDDMYAFDEVTNTYTVNTEELARAVYDSLPEYSAEEFNRAVFNLAEHAADLAGMVRSADYHEAIEQFDNHLKTLWQTLFTLDELADAYKSGKIKGDE